MIILDFETNTMTAQDVIEAAAVKLEFINGNFKVIDKFHRYYLSRYPVNPTLMRFTDLLLRKLLPIEMVLLIVLFLMKMKSLLSFVALQRL